MKKLIVLGFGLLFFSIHAQTYKFGKVSKSELSEKQYPSDTSAHATILYMERISTYNFSPDKGFYLNEEYYMRLKIYNKEGFDKATVEIPVFHSEGETEKVTGIKGVTYNLQNGKIIKTKLSKDAVFKEKKNKYYDIYKFTLPDIKPGSVVEWKYTFQTPYIKSLDEVVLQEDIPIKKLLTKIYIPEFFVYNIQYKGYLPVPSIKKDYKTRRANFVYDDMVNAPLGYQKVHGNAALEFKEEINIIETANVPAIKKEPYAGNINNYKSGILYELAQFKRDNQIIKNYTTTWKDVAKNLKDNSDFGKQIHKTKHFEDDLDPVLSGLSTPEEKISAILEFVKNKVKWNEYYGKYSENGIAQAYKKGKGNVADVNLNLLAMLKYAGLDAEPVLVSTINHGIPMFPTESGFNYVIAKVNFNGKHVLLDATEKYSLPDVLPERVYNFHGLVIKDDGTTDWVDLYPKQHSIRQTRIIAQFTGDEIKGIGRTTLSNNFLLSYRKKAIGKNKDELRKWIDERIEEVDVLNARVSNLENLSKKITETIQFETESFFEEIGDKIYITPLLYKRKKENPFKSEERHFPVFFNKPWAESINVQLSIPEDYNIENIPAPVEYAMPDEIGVFSYSVTPKGNTLIIKSTIVINHPVIQKAHYKDLKEFYNKIILKQNEKIILKHK